MLFDWFSPITYHLLEYGGIDDVIINNILLLLSYKTSRLHASVSNRSQIKSKCGTNKKKSIRGAAERFTDVVTIF